MQRENERLVGKVRLVDRAGAGAARLQLSAHQGPSQRTRAQMQEIVYSDMSMAASPQGGLIASNPPFRSTFNVAGPGYKLGPGQVHLRTGHTAAGAAAAGGHQQLAGLVGWAGTGTCRHASTGTPVDGIPGCSMLHAGACD